MRSASHHGDTGRKGQTGHQKVDQQEVTEVIDSKCSLEAIDRECFRRSALDPGVAHQGMHGCQLPSIQATANFLGEVPYGLERGQVQAHRLYLRRRASRIYLLAQTLHGVLCPFWVAAGDDYVPRTPAGGIMKKVARADVAKPGVAARDDGSAKRGGWTSRGVLHIVSIPLQLNWSDICEIKSCRHFPDNQKAPSFLVPQI